MLAPSLDARRWLLAALLLTLPWATANGDTEAAEVDFSSERNGDDPQFRQQAPIGTTTGDMRELARRIMSTTRYLVTPGDVYELRVRIGTLQVFPLVLHEDFLLEVPFLGTIDVSGQLFSEVRREILSRIKARVPADFVSFQLAAPALFDVFVFGGVTGPGIYTATPLSRVSDIITAAGGAQRGASLRRVELTRGEDARQVDLTRFSSLGDLDANPTVNPGDRIRVRRVEQPVTVTGEVQFPGTFDMLENETLADLLVFAGGTTQGADLDRVVVNRERGATTALLAVGRAEQRTFVLEAGDAVRVPAVTRAEAMVIVRGALFGTPVSGNETVSVPTRELLLHVPFRSGLTALNVLDALGGPTPLAADTGGAIIRAAGNQREEFDPLKLWASRSPTLDVELAPGDEIHVPMQNLFIYVGGEVRGPLAVPYTPAFTVTDYIRAAGGLTEDGGNLVTSLGADNQRSVVTASDRPEPGTSLLIGRSLWGEAKRWMANLTIVAAFVTTAFGVYTAVVSLPSP